MTTKTYQSYNFPFELKREIVDFLFTHLEQFGDDKDVIAKSLNYIVDKGGHLVLCFEGNEIIGAAVVNHTHMDSYIPENILVYLATDLNRRRMGIGTLIMKDVLDVCRGNILLRIDANNPAIKLYEKFGFTNPYLEMVLKR